MNAHGKVLEYLRLRETAVWKLLAADNGPMVLGELAVRFADGGRLPASVFQDALRRDLEELRARGAEYGSSATAYIAQWVVAGYLDRRLLPGEAEESYGITAGAASAIRVVEGISRPRALATESRLATVVALVERLREETDPDPETRIASLEAERERIDRKIDQLRGDGMGILDEARATERAREIIALSEELLGDFIRVGEEFERLNRGLRHSLVEKVGQRGETLERLFLSVDAIADSPAGRAFGGFFRLLMDAPRREGLDAALDDILRRDFMDALGGEERDFLSRLTDSLLERGGLVHGTQIRLARSLRDFVQSREYLEKKRITGLLAEAEQAALSLRERIRPSKDMGISLDRTSSAIRSLSQWRLHDPSLAWTPVPMEAAEPADLDPQELGDLFRVAEIDYRAIKERVLSVLEERAQASVAEVLEAWPADQGLGTVVGLMDLAARSGIRGGGGEEVSWTGLDGVARKARIPVLRFVKEKIDDYR